MRNDIHLGLVCGYDLDLAGLMNINEGSQYETPTGRIWSLEDRDIWA